MTDYLLDCVTCGEVTHFDRPVKTKDLRDRGWQWHISGGWMCPPCERRGSMDHASLDEIDRERAREAAIVFARYETRRTRKRRIVGLVVVSLIAGLVVWLLK